MEERKPTKTKSTTHFWEQQKREDLNCWFDTLCNVILKQAKLGRFLSLSCLPGRRNMPFNKYLAQVFCFYQLATAECSTMFYSPGDITSSWGVNKQKISRHAQQEQCFNILNLLKAVESVHQNSCANESHLYCPPNLCFLTECCPEKAFPQAQSAASRPRPLL